MEELHYMQSGRLLQFQQRTTTYVALYLQFLPDSTVQSAIEEACNSIVWVHSTASLSSPTVSPIVKATLEVLQRLLAKPAVKKAPVTSVMLEEMVRDAEELLFFRIEASSSMPVSVCRLHTL